MGSARSTRNWSIGILFALLASAVVYANKFHPVKTQVAKSIVGHVISDVVVGSSNSNLILGSSSVANMNSEEYLSCGAWVNRGIPASTIKDVARYLKYSRTNTNPPNILIYAGENDLYWKVGVDNTVHQYVQLLETLSKRFPDSLIHVLSIKPSLSREETWPGFMKTNAMLKTYALDHSHILFHEPALQQVFNTGIDEDDSPWFLNDGIHLSESGYQVFVDPINQACRST